MNIKDIKKKSIGLSNIFAYDLSLLCFMNININELRNKLLSNLFDDGIELILCRDTMEVTLFLEKRNKCGFLIKIGFMACKFSALMFQMNNFNMEECFKDINFTDLWSVVNKQVILALGVFANEFICCN